MSPIFISILNMSITASYVAIGVILVRIFLKKAPKVFSYALWGVLLFRLICPVSFSTTFSFMGLLNVDSQNNAAVLNYVPQDIGLTQSPTVQSGIGSLDSAVNSSLPQATPMASVNPMQIWMDVLTLIWLAGVVVLLSYSVISYIKIKRQLLTATLVRDNIYESDRIGTAFVCGVVRPKIYVPVGVGDADLAYILEHERTHIRRKDYLIKPFAFFTLILHWFNPLVWLSFALMSRDMEMSCDESVLEKMNQESRGGYSSSLLALSVKRNGLFAANPLAFGESHIKVRIKNIINYKKPAFWVIVLAVIAITASIVGFTTNPKNVHTAPNSYAGYSIDALLADKTPYVGNNSKVAGLINAMPLPEGIARDTVELQTATLPYGITINYIMLDSSRVMVNGAISGDAFYRNAIMLFSLIDNVDIINCKIANKTGEHNGALYVLTYTREMAEKLTGGDVRHSADSADTLKDMIDWINNIPLGAALVSPVTADAQTEKYLDIIVSSPQASSNPHDYIKAHPNEYESILNMGNESLAYMFSQFEKGGHDDLKGYIMMILCKELLGARNNVTDQTLSPQEWYAALGETKF
jgi:Antirepressor regulating drug resistance, predicted signal transduction N-terminal membrane component